MSIKEGVTPISFRIGENFATDFDELQNIKIQNRKSDIGFSEFNQMSIAMRDGTTQVGNTLTGTGGTSGQFFFIDFYKKEHHLKGYDNKIWSLISDIWTDLSLGFTANTFNFTLMSLPMMLTGSIPTEFTTTVDSSAGERVKKAASDAGGAANIGKYLIITDNSGNTQAYRGAFASILDYDTGTDEYVLNGAGITTELKSGAKYQIYDTLGEHLQISNGAEFEKYIFGKSDGTLVENTTYAGLATKGLRNVKGILDTEFIVKQISYYNSYWTFNKNTLYYSAGALNNPFLYNFTTVLSVPGSISGFITDLFVFKDRLIIGGSNYSAYLKGPISALTEIVLITKDYGMTPNTLVDVGIDGYFISTNKNIYSLKENIAGTTLVATDEGKIIGNYLKDYNFNLAGGFDGKNLYFYGEKVAGETGIMTVLDVQYKFWSTYTGLSPSSIMFNNSKTYLTDNKTGTVYYFDETKIDDLGTSITQKISLKDISVGVPFTQKSLTDVLLWLDNYVQDLKVELFVANPGTNTKKSESKINLSAADVGASSEPLGEGVIGEGVLGGTATTDQISLPMMKKIAYNVDSGVLWKIIITGVDGSPFYLNQLDVNIAIGDTAYFSPDNTI